MSNYVFTTGDWVKKTTGDYVFYGRVVADFFMSDTTLEEDAIHIRYVVQNKAGILHIFSGKQLEPSTQEEVLKS